MTDEGGLVGRGEGVEDLVAEQGLDRIVAEEGGEQDGDGRQRADMVGDGLRRVAGVRTWRPGMDGGRATLRATPASELPPAGAAQPLIQGSGRHVCFNGLSGDGFGVGPCPHDLAAFHTVDRAEDFRRMQPPSPLWGRFVDISD